jgi:alpha-N-arabinofuranosidase
MRTILLLGAFALAMLVHVSATAASGAAEVKVSSRPLHEGRIDPMLFGSFIELLDDLVPGMWAEMLNDRGFDGITRPARWCYFDGRPDICDRQWENDGSWTLNADRAFNGEKSAKLSCDARGRASLSQSGLSVTKGADHIFSGYLRADTAGLHARLVLKAQLPGGEWMELSSAAMPALSSDWKRHEARLPSSGTADRAVFVLEAEGKGNLWADKLSLMPAGNRSGWRDDVVQAIGEMRPAVIRWGGSVCDPGGYRWKDGIGDRDRRRPFPNKVWGRIDSNDVGIDEFCRFCEMVGARPLVCLSFSDGPGSAADLVRYCNDGPETEWGARRAANGHPEPYRVKYWQLGNELGDAAYVAGCPAFCEEMKRADPRVSLLASFPSKELLLRVGKHLAYIGPHHYTPDLGACESDFAKLTEMIRTTPGCEGVRIAVTEWNITAGSWGLGRAKMLTLESALQNARYLNLLVRRSDMVDIGCRSNMTNSFCSGVIETSPSGLLRRPSYHAMKLYAEHSKPIPLRVDGAPEGVDIVACASEDRRAVCVFAVNMKGDPVEIRLDLTEIDRSFRPLAAVALGDTLDERQPDVANHWTSPDRVRTFPLKLRGSAAELPALSATAIECGPPQESK